MIKQSGLKRLGDRRLVIPEHTGNQPDDGVGQHQGAQHAVGQDIVTDRDLVIDEVVGHALVDALIVAAEEDEMLRLGILPGDGLPELPSLGREEDHLGPGTAEFGECRRDRLDLHDHAGASAVGCVVHRAVAVVRPAAEIHRLQLD